MVMVPASNHFKKPLPIEHAIDQVSIPWMTQSGLISQKSHLNRYFLGKTND